MKVRALMFFTNGNYAAFDGRGRQVAEEQGVAWFPIIQDKLSRGVIGDDTTVQMPGWGSTTVAELKAAGRLNPPAKERA